MLSLPYVFVQAFVLNKIYFPPFTARWMRAPRAVRSNISFRFSWHHDSRDCTLTWCSQTLYKSAMQWMCARVWPTQHGKASHPLMCNCGDQYFGCGALGGTVLNISVHLCSTIFFFSVSLVLRKGEFIAIDAPGQWLWACFGLFRFLVVCVYVFVEYHIFKGVTTRNVCVFRVFPINGTPRVCGRIERVEWRNIAWWFAVMTQTDDTLFAFDRFMV